MAVPCNHGTVSKHDILAGEAIVIKSGPFLARRMGWRVGDLVHAIVVEEDKRTSRRSENDIPAAPQYRPRVITLDALPAVQFNRK